MPCCSPIDTDSVTDLITASAETTPTCRALPKCDYTTRCLCGNCLDLRLHPRQPLALSHASLALTRRSTTRSVCVWPRPHPAHDMHARHAAKGKRVCVFHRLSLSQGTRGSCEAATSHFTRLRVLLWVAPHRPLLNGSQEPAPWPPVHCWDEEVCFFSTAGRLSEQTRRPESPFSLPTLHTHKRHLWSMVIPLRTL